MKKTLAILLSAVMMIVMLTGCIHQDMGVKMNKDGTGSITTTLGIEKDFYDQLVSMGSDPFEGKTTTEYEYDGSTYVSYAESKEYSSYEEMEQALLNMTYETELIEDTQEDTSDDGEVDGVIDVAVEAEEVPAQDNHIFSSVSIEKDSGISTLSGYITDQLGHMPECNEQIRHRDFILTVIGTDGRRVTQTRLEYAPLAPEEDDELDD
jgi:hypothetical protein